MPGGVERGIVALGKHQDHVRELTTLRLVSRHRPGGLAVDDSSRGVTVQLPIGRLKDDSHSGLAIVLRPVQAQADIAVHQTGSIIIAVDHDRTAMEPGTVGVGQAGLAQPDSNSSVGFFHTPHPSARARKHLEASEIGHAVARPGLQVVGPARGACDVRRVIGLQPVRTIDGLQVARVAALFHTGSPARQAPC